MRRPEMIRSQLKVVEEVVVVVPLVAAGDAAMPLEWRGLFLWS